MRIKSTLIDNLIVLGLILIFINYFSDISIYIKGILIFVILSYEPVISSKYRTLGQILIGIKVLNYSNTNRNISLLNAYARFLVKNALGWLSFITIIVTKQKRAIHDMIGNTIMVIANET